MWSFFKVLLGPANPMEKLVWLQRKETWEGDMKANRIRIAALFIFAINECLNYYVFHVVDKRFHIGSLLVVFMWFVCAGIFQWMLRHHVWSERAPYLMVSVDLLWMTWLLFLADGPKSPLVAIYFLIIALSGIRLSPRLCLYSSGAAVFGYLSVLQFVKNQAPQFMVPRSHETIVILSLFFMGIIMAHLMSRMLTLLEGSISAKGITHE